MKSLAFASLALLTGCMSTPSFMQSNVVDVRSTDSIVKTSSKDIQTAARCIVKNIEDRIGSMMPMLQEQTDPSSLEVRVRSEAGVAAIVEIAATSSGSTLNVRISNNYPFKQSVADIFTRDC